MKVPVQLVSGHPEKRLYLLDGSNIAYSYGKNKADYALIVLAVDSIQERDANAEVFVVVDASLRYQVRDRQGFEELLSSPFIRQVPAGTSADYFIKKIAESFGKNAKVIIVSNDLYRDMRMKNFCHVKFFPYNIAGRTEIIFYPDLADINPALD
ncbi:MAG: NYN domain-containing protein [Thermoplasmataceae archaeon]